MDMRKRNAGWLVHFIVWAIVFGMPMFVVGPGSPMINGKDYIRFLVIPLSFMVVFYTNYFYLIRKNLSQHRTAQFLLGNVLMIALVMVAVHVVSRYVLPPDASMPPKERPLFDTIKFFSGNAILYMLVAGAGVAIKMTGDWYAMEATRKELEHSNVQAELQNLKSQLNPHFLFNTLNNIYSLIQFDTDRAQRAVHDLSRMLRYVLYDSSQQYVALVSEMQFMRDYVLLMKLRLPDSVDVRVSFPDTHSETKIAPLLFISLVENAFKHGVSYEEPSHIWMELSEDRESVVFDIRNSSFPKTNEDRSGSGIGLNNLSKRLELLYPGLYEFSYGTEGQEYHARLRILKAEQ